MSEVNAWLLNLGEGLLAAVGEREMVHILPDDPELFEIPQSPAYCRNVLVWQGEILPLMNLASRVLDRPVTESWNLVAITAFQEYSEAEVRHGALMLHTPPERIQVNDSHACDLSSFQSGWRHLALACFEYAERGPVPVLDLWNVFTVPHGSTDKRVEIDPNSSHFSVQI